MEKSYIVIPVFTDPFLHPLHKNNKLSFLYTREWNSKNEIGETRIFSELNPDCTKMCEDISWLSDKKGLIITPDSKILQAILPEYRTVLDVTHAHWWIYNKPLDLNIRNNAMEFLSNKFYNVKKLNEIIPFTKHKEYCDEVCIRIEDFLSKDMKTLMDDSSWFSNDGAIDSLKAFSNIEKQGIKVTDDVSDIFDIRVKKHISDGKLYSQYNLLTTTGRPSNSFGTVNFAALPPEKRKAFIPENDSLVEFDFDGYHLRLIGKLVGFDFNSGNWNGTSVHEYFAYRYSALENKEVSYKDAKQKTFQILYGGIRKEHEKISAFFPKTLDYINKKWNEINTHNCIFTDIYRRKLLYDNYDDLNRNKLFNYLIQAYETETNIKKILLIHDYLLGKKTKLVLYGYDSFLFDFSTIDGVETLKQIKMILEDKYDLPINRVDYKPYYLTKSKMGLNYGEMKDITNRL
jgi:predicted nucleic-acid-binding Zn-ribbon protein